MRVLDVARRATRWKLRESAGDRAWTFPAKLLVTVALLAFLFWRIDATSFLRAIEASFGWWLLAALLASFLLIVISILKWHRLLRALGVESSRLALLKLYMMGNFGGIFLPGVVGGDVVRWQLTARRFGCSSAKVAASIVAERASGAAALVLLAVPAVLWNARLGTAPVILFIVLMGGSLVGLIVLGTNRRLAALFARRGRRLPIWGLIRAGIDFLAALRQFSTPVLLVALGYGALFYLTNGLVLLMLCRALELNLGYADALSAQILTNLLGLLPISLGGLGLVQAGHVYFLGFFGVGAANAFAISIVKQCIYYGYGLVGGSFLLRLGPDELAGGGRVPRGTDSSPRGPASGGPL